MSRIRVRSLRPLPLLQPFDLNGVAWVITSERQIAPRKFIGWASRLDHLQEAST